MTETQLHLNQEDLLYIANLLQYLVKKPRDLQCWQDVQEQGGDQLTTTVLMIEKTITAEAFFEPDQADTTLEKINETVSTLLHSLENLGPELSQALTRATEELCKTKKQFGEFKNILRTLSLIREGTVRLIDCLDEKAPKSTNGANNWRTDYLAQYTARYYYSVMNEWPLSAHGNSNNRIRNVIEQIQIKFPRERMGGHFDRADKIIRVLASGNGKLPAPLI